MSGFDFPYDIALSIARRFAKEGFHVVATRRRGDLDTLVNGVQALGSDATAVHSDTRDEDQVAELIETVEQAMYRAAWADGKDLSDAEVLTDVLNDAGFDAEQVMEAMTLPEIKQALITATNEAAERGVFGAPTLFVADEIYFGQDRLEWVERALLD